MAMTIILGSDSKEKEWRAVYSDNMNLKLREFPP
jgi:hypothetical protein